MVEQLIVLCGPGVHGDGDIAGVTNDSLAVDSDSGNVVEFHVSSLANWMHVILCWAHQGRVKSTWNPCCRKETAAVLFSLEFASDSH